MPLQVPMAELLRLAQESRTGDIWTCFPATVQAYTASPAPVADLVPVVQRPLTSAADDSLDFEQLPVLPDVPILFPQGPGACTPSRGRSPRATACSCSCLPSPSPSGTPPARAQRRRTYARTT